MKKLFLPCLFYLFFFIPVFIFSQKTGEFYFKNGNLKIKEKDYYGAIADFTKSIELMSPSSSNYAYAFYNRGLSKSNLKDYYGAVADYTKAIELKPDYSKAYYNRAYNKYKLGQNTCDDYKKAC